MMQNRGVNTAGSAAVVAIAAVLTWTSVSQAETAPASEPTAWPSAPAPVTEQTSYAPPNRLILGGGIIAFVGSYASSVIVASASSNSYDKNLYYPIAGPWLDLSHRPGCVSSEGNCANESAFAGLLIVDGVFQALGAIGTALGFMVPERRTRVVTAKADPRERVPPEKPSIHIVPARVSGDGYGVAAVGKF
jgi:hypothetical protein